MEFIRHKNLFLEHLFFHAFALTSTIKYQFRENLLFTVPLNVQEQLFTVFLHKTVLKNFHKIPSKTLVPSLYLIKFQGLGLQQNEKGLR